MKNMRLVKENPDGSFVVETVERQVINKGKMMWVPVVNDDGSREAVARRRTNGNKVWTPVLKSGRVRMVWKNPPKVKKNLWELWWDKNDVCWIATSSRSTTMEKFMALDKWKKEREEMQSWIKTWPRIARAKRPGARKRLK